MLYQQVHLWSVVFSWSLKIKHLPCSHTLWITFKKYGKVYSVPVFPIGLNNIVCGVLPYLGRTTVHYNFTVCFKCHYKEVLYNSSTPCLSLGDVNGKNLYSIGISYKHVKITLIQIPELLQMLVLINLGKRFWTGYGEYL